jgi:hypothetical protein
VRHKHGLTPGPEECSKNDGRQAEDSYQHDEYFCQISSPASNKARA